MVISLFRLFLDTHPQISSDRRPQLPFSSTSNFWTYVLSCFQQKTTTSIFLYFACFRFCLLKFSALLLLAEASSIPMTRSEQKNKRSSLSNTAAEIKFNRRKKYKEMLPAQKDKLLLQRRTRDLESARRSLQVPLVIREPCVTSTKAATSEVHTSADSSLKGKSLFHPSCVFETGEYNNHLIYVSFQWPEAICFSNS